MAAEIKTELGNITLSETVIARIAGLAATECYGVIGMAAKSVRDGIVMLLKMDSLTRGVIVRVKDNVISVDLHVIMEYGINIPAISETISSTVKYKVQEFTGFDVDVVNIFVEGIREKISKGIEEIPAKVITKDEVRDITLYVKGLTEDEKDIILKGCLMNYYAAKLN